MPKILIIDDDEVLLHLLQNLLKDQGYEILATADGPRGIDLYKEQQPDLVLLDLGLPSLNGLEVLREIHEFDDKARVIIVTGYGSRDTADVASRSGASGFFQKPFDFEVLLHRIRVLLGE